MSSQLLLRVGQRKCWRLWADVSMQMQAPSNNGTQHQECRAKATFVVASDTAALQWKPRGCQKCTLSPASPHGLTTSFEALQPPAQEPAPTQHPACSTMDQLTMCQQANGLRAATAAAKRCILTYPTETAGSDALRLTVEEVPVDATLTLLLRVQTTAACLQELKGTTHCSLYWLETWMERVYISQARCCWQD